MAMFLNAIHLWSSMYFMMNATAQALHWKAQPSFPGGTKASAPSFIPWLSANTFTFSGTFTSTLWFSPAPPFVSWSGSGSSSSSVSSDDDEVLSLSRSVSSVSPGLVVGGRVAYEACWQPGSSRKTTSFSTANLGFELPVLGATRREDIQHMW